VRVGEVDVGSTIRTRLTHRLGTVVSHDSDKGVGVEWVDKTSKHLHPDVEVDAVGAVGCGTS
jgi:hypothetical protein